jgi:hypothetical protein
MNENLIQKVPKLRKDCPDYKEDANKAVIASKLT